SQYPRSNSFPDSWHQNDDDLCAGGPSTLALVSCSRVGHAVGQLLRAHRRREQKPRWDFKPERGSGRAIDHQLIFGGLLIGQITRLLAAQDAIDVGGGAAIEFDAIHAVERQASV